MPRRPATESMLVWDAEAGRYDAAATSSTGRETLADYHARLLNCETAAAGGERTGL